MTRRLFLHAGPHKTGTTSVQNALYDHRRSLLQDGLAVCHGTGFCLTATMANAARMANVFIRPALRTAPRLNGRLRPADATEERRVAGRLRAFVAASPCRDFVVSSEEFSALRTPEELRRLTSFLKPFFDTVVPVVVLRDVAAWRASRQAQLERNGLAARLRDLPDADNCAGDWYFDHKGLLDFWQTVGPVRTIVYEEALAHDGSVLPAVFAAFDRKCPAAAREYWFNRRERKAEA